MRDRPDTGRWQSLNSQQDCRRPPSPTPYRRAQAPTLSPTPDTIQTVSEICVIEFVRLACPARLEPATNGLEAAILF